MKNTIRNTPQTRGFALVATLYLMILLAILAVGLLSLSAVTLRTAGQGSAQAEARANARMALMVAIGELQKQMGPDQRVSANGSILSDSTVNHPHWTGVWDSWIAGPLEDAPISGNYPSGSEESHHQTIGEQPPGSMRPAYDRKDEHFRAWLLSLEPGETGNPDLPTELALEGQTMPGNDSTAVRLVGEGSLGNGTAADYVSARLLPVRKDTTVGNPAGRYAWWVGDESQKARVMHNSYHGETLTSADKIFRSQAPASTGTTAIAGLADLTPDEEQRLEGLPTLDTLDLVPGVREINDGGTFRASQKGFHSVTPFSRSVLSDVREGGLKRDLSTLLERPVDPTERYGDYDLDMSRLKLDQVGPIRQFLRA